jgi:hypothetical protein
VIERDRDEEMGFLLRNNCESENEKKMLRYWGRERESTKMWK